MRSCFCPSCGASLSFDDNNKDFGFCQYCGTKIMLDDYRSTHRIVDEARIQEAENERIIRMREMDIEEKEEAHYRKGRNIAFSVAGGVAVIGAICALFAPTFAMFAFAIAGWIALFTVINGDDRKKKMAERRKANSGMIKLTSNAATYDKKDFRSVQAAYQSLGFTNIQLINLRDLRTGLLKKPGTVETVTINGESPHTDEWYYPNAHIAITYHGFVTDT